jgi:F-box domain
MSSQFLDLSTELVIQILAHGSVRDIGACARTSRRLYGIVSGSQYLRYLLRTKMAGVHDPFLLPGLSIPERLSALERWERAWHNLDLRRQPALECIVPRDVSASILRYEIHGGYLVGARRFRVDADRPLGYGFVDLHEAVGRGYPSWNNVDLHRSLSVFSYCFNVEEHNLAVMLV